MVPESMEARTVSIGRIITRTFTVMRNNPVAVFGIAFLFAALPQLILGDPTVILSTQMRQIFTARAAAIMVLLALLAGV